ncbi:MAG TPA: ABC transporter permease [Thermoleophilia bacterium]|nr:ABC transporter permease [Thermoleophilia bacterium]
MSRGSDSSLDPLQPLETLEPLEPLESIPLGGRPRREWVQTISDAWRMRRTKIGFVVFLVLLTIALFGRFVAPYEPTEFVGAPFSLPSAVAWLGTDFLGRDVLTRVLYGGLSVFVLGIAATVIGVVLGVSLGLVSGYARRWVDESIMRMLDVVLAFPSIVLAMLFVSILGPRLWLIVLMVGISHMPRIARVTRAATVEVVARDFVTAAAAVGVTRRKILLYEVLPNISSPLLVEFGLRLTYSIIMIAALSFLGFGMQPPAADWGLMINENRIGITIQPWTVIAPIVLIGALTVSTNLMADGLARAMMGIDRDTAVI